MLSLIAKEPLALTRPRLSTSVAIRHNTLLENADLKEIKRTEGEMQGTLGIYWTDHAEDEQENFALMAYSNSGSYTEREQLGDASIEIKAYTQALKKVEAQLVAHQKNQLCMSSDVEDSPVYDRFAKVEGMHAVPPLMTGNYMPPKSDFGIDESNFTYGTASINVTREVELTASIDGQAKTITEASLRRHLKLEDNSGITSLPNTEIFEQLALMGYATDSDKATFQKGIFTAVELRVDQQSEMEDELLIKIYNIANRTKELKCLEASSTETKLSTARPKLSTNNTKIESMKLEAMVEERRIFKCWFHFHTTNGNQFTMSNRHQELASPEQTAPGKDFSNPLMADSVPKTIWLSTHHALQ
ncbi:hypothetical protein Tco_0526976 [Tanacetum coccineum]